MLRIFSLTILLAAGALARANSVSELSWLQGNWKGEFQGGTYETYFSAPGAGVVLGIARQMDASASQLLFFEFTSIHETPTGFGLSPMPFGRSEGAQLVSAEAGPGRITFINSADKFPQKIVYEVNKSGQLVVTVSGTKDNQPILYQIVQNRK